MTSNPRNHISRRDFSLALFLASLTNVHPSLSWAAKTDQMSDLTIWGIPASPSALIARAVASGSLDAIAPDVAFKIWKSTDQMRAGIASGDFKIFATSTYAAANFHNRGAGTVMMNVFTWGVLYVMAREKGITRIEDLAGKKVLLSNKNEAPDLLFRLVLKWNGLDPDKDVELDYVGSPMESVPLFLKGRGDVAVLHEPASTAALLKAKQMKVPVYRAIDITEVYGAHTGRGPKIPQVGLAVNPDFLERHSSAVSAVHEAIAEAGQWVADHPMEAGALAAKTLPLAAPIIAKSLPFVHLDVKSAKESRTDIELYFEHLMSLDPGIVGGKLPGDGFYWG